ncbi:MAG: hypothetical protein JXB19_10710 [Bacteroidales bacterium]|nr:hypothetical protein [Bacteroidales bacterium]
METKPYDRRLWLGIGVVLIGLFFLADNFGLLDYQIRRYFFRWEVLLMIIGLVFVLGQRSKTTGIILLVIGGVFYMRDFLHWHFNFWQLFWPSLLIFIGVLIIFRHKIDKDWHDRTIISDDDIIDELAFFGGGDRIVKSQHFKGGKVTTVFGGLNYDMFRAKLAPGKNYIDVFCLFGGMKIMAPEDWNIKIRVVSIFGGFSEKQRYIKQEGATDEGTQLIIKGTVIFGGGEIKRYPD